MADLINELRSLQRYINAALPGTEDQKPVIYTGRSRTGLVRPAFKIDLASESTIDATSQMYFDQRMWVITYMAKEDATTSGSTQKSRTDAESTGPLFVQKLKNTKPWLKIPLWLFDYTYLAPILREVTGAGATLGAGTFSFQILAEDLLGNITKLGPVASITIASGSAIDVQCPQYPMGNPLGKKIHVYLSGATTIPTAGHRVGSVNMANGIDPVLRVVQDVPGGTSSGNATALASALPAHSEVRYRYMAVDQLRGSAQEDYERDGLWNYVARLTTSTIGVRDYEHARTLAAVSATVNVGT